MSALWGRSVGISCTADCITDRTFSQNAQFFKANSGQIEWESQQQRKWKVVNAHRLDAEYKAKEEAALEERRKRYVCPHLRNIKA